MKEAVKRTIFSNYNLWENYEECAREHLEELEIPATEENVWEEIHTLEELEWECARDDLEAFFDEGYWILQGMIGRWNGSFEGGFIFSSYHEMMSHVADLMDSFRFYDVNGHFYIDCSHHDGSCHFEVRKLTEKGINYWYKNYCANNRELHNKLMEKNYSVLPHYAHKVYGVPKVEYKKKEDVADD